MGTPENDPKAPELSSPKAQTLFPRSLTLTVKALLEIHVCICLYTYIFVRICILYIYIHAYTHYGFLGALRIGLGRRADGSRTSAILGESTPQLEGPGLAGLGWQLMVQILPDLRYPNCGTCGSTV